MGVSQINGTWAVNKLIMRKMLIYAEGPFLISSEVRSKPVFWMVEEFDQGYHLIGTESVADASFFYIIPVGDPTHPSEFHIVYYWGPKGRHYTMHVDDLYRTYDERGPPLPYYLSTHTDRLGISKDSLSLKTCVEIKQARFSLHSRVQSSFFWMICSSTPVDLCSWLEGEQFYIKCSSRSIFKVDSYLAVEKAEGNQYKVTTVVSVLGNNPAKTGLLFRLHPKVIKDNAVSDELKSTQTDMESPPVHANILKLLIPAIFIGTAGIFLYIVARSIS